MRCNQDKSPFATCAFLTLWVLAVVDSAATSPNFVLIVADDLGYGDLQCYGSRSNHTPNIDALARHGVRFLDFHTSGPMCTPTRVSILTGQYQQRFGARFDGPLSGESDRNVGLPHAAITIAEVLKEAGYVTACFGKWHLGYQPPWLPLGQGFDEFRGLGSGDGDHHTHIDRWGNEDWWHNNELAREDGYTTDLLTKHSVTFIEKHRDRPFFLYLPHLAIHFPWQGPKDPSHRVKGENYKNDKWGVIPDPTDVRPHVAAMVEAIDRSTGDIVATLRRLQLDERTVVFFTSDNGGYLNYGNRFQNISSNGELRGQKGTLYEGGHRVPLIVSWPRSIRPAKTDAVAHSNDLFPTIAALAAADVQGLKLDGVDLSSLLINQSPLPARTLFWRAGDEWAVRSGPWKLVFENGRRELFNLDRDLGERNDVSKQHPKRVTQLAQSWSGWEIDVNQTAAKQIAAQSDEGGVGQ